MASAAVPERAERISVMLRAQIFSIGGAEPTAHRVINLSADGARIGGASSFAVRSTVLVSIGQIEYVAADVVWVKGDFAGLNFRTPIDVGSARLRPHHAGPPPPSAGWLAELNDHYRR